VLWCATTCSGSQTGFTLVTLCGRLIAPSPVRHSGTAIGAGAAANGPAFRCVKAQHRGAFRFRAVLEWRQSLVPRNSCAPPKLRPSPSPSAGSGGAIAYIGLAASSFSDGPLGVPWAERGALTQPEADLEVCLHSGGLPRD